jgi:hypothetical protein
MHALLQEAETTVCKASADNMSMRERPPPHYSEIDVVINKPIIQFAIQDAIQANAKNSMPPHNNRLRGYEFICDVYSKWLERMRPTQEEFERFTRLCRLPGEVRDAMPADYEAYIERIVVAMEQQYANAMVLAATPEPVVVAPPPPPQQQQDVKMTPADDERW